MTEDGEAPAGAAATNPGEKPQFVTVEQLNQFQEKMASDLKATFGRIPNLINESIQGIMPKQPEAKATDKVDPHAEVAALLKSEREALALEKTSVTKERLRSDIEKELLASGVRPESVKLAADSLMMRNDGRLEVERGDLGESRSIYRDSQFAEPLAINSFIANFVKTQEGMAILTPKKGPSLHDVPGGRGPITGEVIMMTRAEASRADPKLLKSGRVTFTD